MNDFYYCPNCGSKDVANVNMRKWFCSKCNFELYNNVATAVGLIITNSDGYILFEKRAKEPRKGYYAFPGGFVDPNETAEEAAYRECKEELGVEIESLKYLGSFPNTYEYRNITYKTCDLFFAAKIPNNVKYNILKEEVLKLEFLKVENDDDISNLQLAFDSAKKILKIYLKNKDKV